MNVHHYRQLFKKMNNSVGEEIALLKRLWIELILTCFPVMANSNHEENKFMKQANNKRHQKSDSIYYN